MVSLKSSFVAFVLALPTFVAAQTQTCTPLPAGVTLRSNPKLPDPFTFYDGTKVTTKEQWECVARSSASSSSVSSSASFRPSPRPLLAPSSECSSAY
ncbi:hypothetical protein NMY22_g4678 [Coprinellus aureogranulatus]|nr:hypothetical protein NMY22_g4678 [Coprinellus aureogranulatus]